MHSRTFASLVCLSAVALSGVACGDLGGDLSDAPADGGPPGGPGGPPTTGGKWEGHETTDDCGRTSIEWRIVDEVCAGTDADDYLDHFRAPIMRDGARIGDRLYAVDATHLWVLDVSTPSTPVRKALLTGFGQPLSVATHQGRLLVAAGDEGLVIVDVSNVDAPVRAQTIATDGPALDVFVDGDRAYVATGDHGVVVVKLGGTASVIGRVPVDRFAAGVAVRDGVAYVAACDALVTFDTSSGDILGETWVDDAVDADGVLVAPAKDVFVGEAGVFVAAGRYGAVRVDASDPAAPEVLGNCTLAEEVGFYASGVRASGDKLLVAGGEWGILPIDLADESSCTSRITPAPIPAPPGTPTENDDGTCTTDPPWETLPWQDTWLPPVQAGQDPLQTLPDDEVLYAFGDATRIGMRAVDVRLVEDVDLEKVGRYEEPRVTTAIAVQGSRVLVLGRWGGIFERDGAGLVAEEDAPIEVRDAAAGVFLEDGRWALGLAEPRRVIAEDGTVVVLEGASETLWPGTMSASGNDVIVSDELGAVLADMDEAFTYTITTGRVAELPAAVVARAGQRVVIAAPEWTEAVEVDANGAAVTLAPHEIFGAQEVASIDAWRTGLPRRILASSGGGVLELATLGRRAGVALHDADGGSVPLELPPGEYVGLSVLGDRAYAVSIDRGTYRSQLVTVSLAGGAPNVVAVDAWTGMASGVAATDDGVFVADRDVGVRIYDAASDGVSLAAVVALAGGAQ